MKALTVPIAGYLPIRTGAIATGFTPQPGAGSFRSGRFVPFSSAIRVMVVAMDFH
jgi:hypothetical protein